MCIKSCRAMQSKRDAKGSTSLPGGDQVDGLPPVSSEELARESTLCLDACPGFRQDKLPQIQKSFSVEILQNLNSFSDKDMF